MLGDSNRSGALPGQLERCLRLSLVSCCVLTAMGAVARADDVHRITLLEENDSLYTDYDRHYSQGLRLSDLTPDIGPESMANRPFDLVGGVLPIFSQDKASTAGARQLRWPVSDN